MSLNVLTLPPPSYCWGQWKRWSPVMPTVAVNSSNLAVTLAAVGSLHTSASAWGFTSQFPPLQRWGGAALITTSPLSFSKVLDRTVSLSGASCVTPSAEPPIRSQALLWASSSRSSCWMWLRWRGFFFATLLIMQQSSRLSHTDELTEHFPSLRQRPLWGVNPDCCCFCYLISKVKATCIKTRTILIQPFDTCALSSWIPSMHPSSYLWAEPGMLSQTPQWVSWSAGADPPGLAAWCPGRSLGLSPHKSTCFSSLRIIADHIL